MENDTLEILTSPNIDSGCINHFGMKYLWAWKKWLQRWKNTILCSNFGKFWKSDPLQVFSHQNLVEWPLVYLYSVSEKSYPAKGRKDFGLVAFGTLRIFYKNIKIFWASMFLIFGQNQLKNVLNFSPKIRHMFYIFP